MARAIDEAPSNVAAWKRVGRIPAEKQPHVLEVGLAMGLPITAEHIVFPLGQPDAAAVGLPSVTPSVAGKRCGKTSRAATDTAPANQ